MKYFRVLVFVLLPLVAGAFPSEAVRRRSAPKRSSQHRAPRTTLIRFAAVDAGVYRGSKPKTDADFRLLRSKGIKTIVNLQFLPMLDGREKKAAKKHGIEYIAATISGSPVEPSEKHVAEILTLLRDHRRHPIYFHCLLGRDRTSLIAALYKMYFLGMSQKDAWRYMRNTGFKDSWNLRGLKSYYFNHPRPPAALRNL
jgi:protein tyrosine/serine phosphatase